MLCCDSKRKHTFMWILMKIISGWFFNLQLEYDLLIKFAVIKKRWCTGGELLTRQWNLGENKSSWNKIFHSHSKRVCCSYTWCGGEENSDISRRTLMCEDWDTFYLWRKDINLYLKNVVLASLYFSLEYLEISTTFFKHSHRPAPQMSSSNAKTFSKF